MKKLTFTILAAFTACLPAKGVEEVGHPTFCSPHASPIAVNDGSVFVVNTPSDTFVKMLLEQGSSPTKDNDRGETPIEVASGEWSDELAGFYALIARAVGMEIDLERIQRERPKIAKLLRESAETPE